MRFTKLLAQIEATYPEESRAFHVIATRYYLDIISWDELKQMATEDCHGRCILSIFQVNTIIRNR